MVGLQLAHFVLLFSNSTILLVNSSKNCGIIFLFYLGGIFTKIEDKNINRFTKIPVIYGSGEPISKFTDGTTHYGRNALAEPFLTLKTKKSSF